jgi:transcriptional regulator with XRE-family HTH domain
MKMLRAAAGVKQGSFARSIGVTQSYLSALESDKRRPSLRLVERIADELGVPPNTILCFTLNQSDVPPEWVEVLERLQDLESVLLRQLVSSARNGTRKDES